MATIANSTELLQHQYLTPNETAQLLRLHVNSVYAGIKEGTIPALVMTRGKKAIYRVPVNKLLEMQERQLEGKNK